jgi:hypothetical protein
MFNAHRSAFVVVGIRRSDMDRDSSKESAMSWSLEFRCVSWYQLLNVYNFCYSFM